MRNAGSGNPSTNSKRRRLKDEARTFELKEDLISRLSRAEGQLRGLQRMIAENVYCVDILQQITAVRRALDKVALIVLRDHLKTCVRQAMVRQEAHDKVEELIQTLDRFLAS